MKAENSKKNRIWFVLGIIFAAALVLFGFIQTVMLKNKQQVLASLQNQNTQNEEYVQQLEDELDYKTDGNYDIDDGKAEIGKDYGDEYLKNEENYGNDGDIIVKVD